MEAFSPLQPQHLPQLSCLPRLLEGSHPSCPSHWCPSSSGGSWGAPHPRGLWWLSFPQQGLQGADVGTWGGIQAEGSCLQHCCLTCCRHQLCPEPPNLLPHLPAVLWVFRRCKYQEKGIFPSLCPVLDPAQCDLGSVCSASKHPCLPVRGCVAPDSRG